jgi:hypothetical protein
VLSTLLAAAAPHKLHRGERFPIPLPLLDQRNLSDALRSKGLPVKWRNFLKHIAPQEAFVGCKEVCVLRAEVIQPPTSEDDDKSAVRIANPPLVACALTSCRALLCRHQRAATVSRANPVQTRCSLP